MSAVLEAFLSALPDSKVTEFSPETERVLEDHFESARAAWPEFGIGADAFANELGLRLGKDATRELLDACKASDVYLAIACMNRNDAAARAFDKTVESILQHAAKKTRASTDQVKEARSQLQRLLYVDEPPNRTAALRKYAGRSPIRSFVSVIASRELIRLIDKRKREVSMPSTLLSQLTSGGDPELSILRERYQSEVEAACAKVLANLDEATRALLSLRFAQGRTLEQIGAFYNIKKQTAYDRVQRACRQLADAIQAELATQLNIPPNEVDSIVQLVRSRIYVPPLEAP